MKFIRNSGVVFAILFLPALCWALPQVHSIDSLQERLVYEKDAENRFNLLIALCEQFSKIQLDSALYYGQEAYQLAQSLAQPEKLALSQYHQAKIHIRKEAPEKSLPFALEATKQFTTLQDTSNWIKSLNVLGASYLRQGMIVEALPKFYKSRDLAIATGDSRAVAAVNGNIAIIENRSGHYEEAISFIQEALDYLKDIDDPVLETSLKNNLALNYYSLGKLDEAIETYKSILALAEHTGNTRGKAMVLSNLHELYFEKGRVEMAIRLAEQALELKREIGMGYSITADEMQLSEYFLAIGDLEKAQDYAELIASNLSKSPYNLSAKTRYLQHLSKVYEASGQYEKAFRAYQEYKVLAGSLATIGNDKAIEIIKTEYKVKEKKRENEVLILMNKRLDNERKLLSWLLGLGIVLVILLLAGLFYIRQQHRQVEKQRNALKESNAYKDKLFSIIAHDLKGPANSFNNLTKLVHYLVQQKDYDRLEKLANQFQESGQKLSVTLNNLLLWSMSQREQLQLFPENIILNDVLQEVIEFVELTAQAKNVLIDQTALPKNLSVYADQRTLFIILTNIITNAIKFSNSGSPIRISGYSEANHHCISVQDCGIGMPSKLVSYIQKHQDLPKRSTITQKQGVGLGLKTCFQLIKLNQGYIEIESQPQKGTTIFLFLPKGLPQNTNDLKTKSPLAYSS